MNSPTPTTTGDTACSVIIGITPDQTTVYAEFYYDLLLQTMVKFCVYRGLGGDYSYSNMTNYFKMNNYSKFYCKTVIVTTAIMSDKREYQGYAVFYRGSISSFSQSESRTHLCHVRMGYQMPNQFAPHRP